MNRLTISTGLALISITIMTGTAVAAPAPHGLALELVSAAGLDQVQEQENPYLRARQLFREGRFSLTVEILETALAAGNLGPSRASAWLLLAAARLGADVPEMALTALDGLEREYPDGPYQLERRWLRGRSHSRAGRYYDAALIFADLAEEEETGRVSTAARDELAALITEQMQTADLQRLGNRLSGTDLKGWMATIAADELANRGDIARARRLLERIEAETPTAGYGEDTIERITSTRERLTSTGPSGLVIGVLAPLSGPDAAAGQEIMNAVRLAAALSDTEMDFKMRNTDGTILGTAEGTLSLIRDEGAQVLIGPVVEELALIAASIAEGSGVPILLPHTHSEGATSLGENVYQLQATPKIQAEFLADTAIDSLGMQTFAVLHPVAGEALEFAEAFMSRVEERGGSIIARGEYFAGATDWQPQMQAIRRAGLTLSLADTSDVSVLDTVTIDEADEDTLEALVPVGSIDAFVAPGINSEDTAYIAVQVSFWYLVTTILGGPAWNSYSVLNSGGPYVRGTIFTDTYSDTWASATQVSFANNYYAMFSERPGRAATLAYDAAMLAIAAWQMAPEGLADRRQALRRWLSGVSGFEGASGMIDFATNARINNNIFFLTIGQDRIEPVTLIGPPDAPPAPPPGI